MESFFSNIGTWISSLPSILIFILMLTFGVSFIFKDAFSVRIKNFKFNRKKKEVEDFQMLKNHDLFTVTERIKDEIKFIKFYTHGEFCEVKTKMCIDFTTFKCDKINETFTQFLDTPGLDKMNLDELKQLIFNHITRTSIGYTESTKMLWISKGIPPKDVDYVINLFDKYRHDVIKAFTNRIVSIFSSDFHSSNFERVLACYEIFTMAIDLLPMDMVQTFESVNGKFKNVKYS